jgi:DNA-binding response OmpR family regulator
MKVLIIEDNMQISANVVRYLALNDITCESSLDGKEGFQKALNNHYDVIILDINLP